MLGDMDCTVTSLLLLLNMLLPLPRLPTTLRRRKAVTATRKTEFGPTFLHIKGEKNVIADALSRLDADFSETLPVEPTNKSMAYIFLTTKDIKETDFLLSPILISKYQGLDKDLKRRTGRNR
jgi:hypothetical protein